MTNKNNGDKELLYKFSGEWKLYAWEILCNLVLATMFAMFSYNHLRSYLYHQKLSALLLFINVLLLVAFYLIRRFPREVTLAFLPWLYAFGGTFTPLLLRPSSGFQEFTIGLVVQYISIILQISSVLSLNRSFGIVPANRGIKTSGMYRFVRHPLYSAYVLSYVGFLINNYKLSNLLIVIAAFCFQVARLISEEDFLQRDPAYKDYMKLTKWRLIPFIF